MWRHLRQWIFLLIVCFFGECSAQETCYPAGGVAGIVIATIVVTAVVMGLGTAAAWRYWKLKKVPNKKDGNENHQKQSMQKSPGDFAFDNPYFRDQEGDDADGVEKGKARSSINKNSLRSSKQSDLSKNKKSKSGKNPFMFGVGGKKHRALDDSCLAVEPERTVVALRGHDFTGLGFNICGNMRDGILVKDVLHRGPASESGLIKAGDRIISVTVSFTNIVYEDALTILSYASPYDVQLELERIPDKSRALHSTPSGSKRLGSCSFNNSGQKLFHPLYRSQSIDDLTQIDKDTFPSHGIGPRRSQSVGVAAHKLATHFKNSNSKLEDKERSPASLILSTTGSLNEKMLANVMADGSLHKNGLQWEKRFEDTLESEDSGSNNCNERNTKKNATDSKKLHGAPKGSTSSNNNDDGTESSDEATHKSQNYAKKSRDYRDSPHNKGKLEAYRPSRKTKNEEAKTTAQVHQLERLSGRRAKTMAEASSALWHLDQSIKDGDTSISDIESPPWNSQDRDGKMDSQLHKNAAANKKCSKADGDYESDVSRDSLELSNKKCELKKSKKCSSISNISENLYEKKPSVSDANSGNIANKQMFHHKNAKKHMNQADITKSTERSNDICKNEYSQISERVHESGNRTSQPGKQHKADTVVKEKMNYDMHDEKMRYDVEKKKPHAEHRQSAVYANQRELQDKLLSNRNSQFHSGDDGYSKANGRNIYSERQELNSPEIFSQNYNASSRNIVNGEVEEHKNRFVQNSKCGYPQKNPPLSYQKQASPSNLKVEGDSRMVESKNKSNLNQKVVKKTSNPAGMFTQINPFQQPSRQKNGNFKSWGYREDTSKDLSMNGSEQSYSSTTLNSSRTTCDSAGQRTRRDTSDSPSYNQRAPESGVSRTVLISSFDNNAGRSPINMQSNLHKVNYRHK